VALRRRFAGQSLTRSPRRKTAWGVGPSSDNLVITSTTSALWTQGVVLNLSDAATLVRTRGEYLLRLTTSAAITDGFLVGLGIGVVTSAAFNAGVASVPTPITEESWDGWLWHKFVNLFPVTTTIADGANALAVAARGEIDSKAMRKINQDMTVFGAIETIEVGVATVRFGVDSRLLLKLH